MGKKGSVVSFNAKASTVGGRYATPIDLASSQAAGIAVFDKPNAYSEKQPNYFRVDFKISYRKEYKKSTLEASIDFQNLTNNKNISVRGMTRYRTGFTITINKVFSRYRWCVIHSSICLNCNKKACMISYTLFSSK